jgi:hypothetical protein
MSVATPNLDLDRLLKLRLVVARFGEMDLAKWWNTKGQLGRLGVAALRRGLPRTHRFAHARSVFAVAAHRCSEVFEPPGCVTISASRSSTSSPTASRPSSGSRSLSPRTRRCAKQRALIPIENKRNFLGVSADVLEHVDPRFSHDPKTAAMKVVGA